MRNFLTIASLLSAFAISLLASTAPARAEITVTQAEYAAGVLVVRGETSRPNQRVTLDERYSTRTDRFKEFRFRIRYLPPDCGISLRAGREVRPARVANCDIVLPRPGVSSGGQTRMRVVRRPCPADAPCSVICEEGEFAINAFCPGSDAKLSNERTVSCGSPSGGQIVAYCLAPGKD